MKLRLYSLMASVLMASGMATAQVSQTPDSVTERMSDYLLDGDREVKTTAPMADGYLPFGAEYVNYSMGSDVTSEKHTSLTGTDTKMGSGTVDPGMQYCYVLSKGVTGKPNDAGVIFYAYFSKSQFKIVKYNTLTNKVLLISEVMPYGSNEVMDITNTEFIKEFRLQEDIINNCVANDTRRNEVFQSSVDLNTIDYNNDGTSDLCLMLGTTLYIFNGQDLSVMYQQKWGTWNIISPTSVVYDFNGDGIDDYLSLHTYRPYTAYGGPRESSVAGGLLLSSRDAQGNVTFNYSKKTMNIADLALTRYPSVRATMSMHLYYPEGKDKAPRLAIATSDAVYASYKVLYYFDQQLTILDFSAEKLCNNESDWYTPVCYQRRRDDAFKIDEGAFTYKYYRQRPYLFGRPAMNVAFSQGYDKPQRIFWVDRVLVYEKEDNRFEEEICISGKHDTLLDQSTYGRFDRVVGGQVEVITGCEPKEAKQGVESFVMVVAGSKDRNDIGTVVDFYDWEDVNYYVTNLTCFDDFPGDWRYLPRYNSVNCFKPMTITKTSADKGMHVELIDKRAVASTPIINHVLSAAPYEAGNVKSMGKTTINFGNDNGCGYQLTTNSFGGYADEYLDECLTLKAAVHLSETKAWNNVSGNTVSRKHNTSADNTTGQDLVVYNYFPADRFTYRITACPSAPDLVGSEFSLVKAQGDYMYLDALTVDEFNQLVEGSSCPQITNDVLRHTAGRIDSYVSGYNDSDSIMAAYGIDRADCLGVSGDIERATLNDDESVTAEYGQYLYIDESQPFTFGNAVSFAPGMKEWSFDNDGTAAFDWTQSTTLNRNSSVTCTLPMAETNPTYNGIYRMVWYKYTIDGTEGKPAQSFMVVNYYVCTGGNTYMAKGNIDSFDTTDIAGIDADKTIESVKYFDTTGREIAQPTQGMYMKVTTYTDGTRDTKKLMAR